MATMTIKSGYLKKRAMSSALVKNWRRRWFVLTETELIYYADREGEKKGELLLDMHTLIKTDVEEWKKNPGSFIVKSCGKDLHVIATNANIR